MDAIEMIKERRSVRKFKNEKVDRELMKEIVDIAKWAPSWVNYQIARYTLVDDEEIIKEMYNLSLIFPREYLCTVYLIAISKKHSLFLKADSIYDDILKELNVK